MNLSELTAQSLAKAREAAMNDPSMKKAITVGTGIVGYNLQAPAHQLVPLMSPFHASIPRIVKAGANSDNWRVISALSSPNPFTTESAASALFTTTLTSPTAAFCVLGIQGSVTLEAQRASEGFDPALAKETSNALLVGMKLEEQAFFGANHTDLGTPVAPAAPVSSAAGGTITQAGTTYYVAVIGLTVLAANRATLDTPADIDINGEALLAGRAVTAAEVLAISAPTTAAPTVFSAGCGVSPFGAIGSSAALTATLKGLKITWTPLKGAVAYILFVGTTTGAANMHAECIVGGCTVTLTSLAGTGVVGTTTGGIPGTDETGDANAYDGIIAQLCGASSGAYVKNLAGALTATATGGEIVEIQDAFAQIYKNAKIGKFRVVASGNDTRTLSRLGAASNAMIIVAQPTGEGRGSMTLGSHVGEILNSTTGDKCPVETNPWLPQGSMLILPMEIPYPSANISQPFQWVGSYDWTRWDYASTPTTGPIYPFEVRNNGVLEGLFTGGCGLIYNIYKGRTGGS